MIRATYFDGRTAAGHAVTVRVESAGLTLILADGSTVFWPVGAITVTERNADGIRLETGGETPQLLVAQGPALGEALLAAHPRLGRASGRLWARVALLAGPALLAGYLMFAYGLPLFGRVAARLVPLNWEDQLGRSVTAGFLRDRACDDGAAARELDAIVTRLSPTVTGPYRFRVRIANDTSVNALAAPGGHIVVFKGLIQQTATPEELAAVLAHEMQHVVQRHAMSALLRGVGLSAAVSILIGDPTFILTAGTFLSELHFHREDEERADRAALEMLARARIDPNGMVRVMRMLARESPKMEGNMRYLSTHPLPADRIAWAEQAARQAGYTPAPMEPVGGKWPPAVQCEPPRGK